VLVTASPVHEPRSHWQGEDGARRLLVEVRAACAGCEGLPARLEAALRAALGLLASEPDLARLLTVDPYLGEDRVAFDAHRRWVGRLGDMLRAAAAEDPRASRGSDFLAAFLIGGVRFQVARLVLNGECAELLRLLPGTLEALLAYYFEPGEPPRLAREALAHHRAA
jgi:hypothetical protein